MRRAAKVLLAVVAVVVVGMPVYSLCERSPDDVFSCGRQCEWGSSGVSCAGISEDKFRACWFSAGSCGEATDYELCSCGRGAGGF